MRTRAGFLGALLVLLLGAGVAWLAYQAGLSQAATTAVASGATTVAPVVVYGGWGYGGFPIFGIIFGLIFLFVVARIVFGIFFWRGPRHWDGRGWGRGYGPDASSPWGPLGPRGDRIAELHRRLHEEEAAAATPGGAAGSGPTSPAGQTGPARD